MKNINKIFLSSMLVVSLFSCKKEEKAEPASSTPTPTQEASLYTRLGGIGPITAVVDKFIGNCASNSFIGPRFAATASDAYRLKYFRYNLIDQICAGSGGPCTYKGQTMIASHTGMNISNAEFDTLVVQLVNALNYYQVPSKEQTDLANILLPMRTDIVGK